jgi:hypothetical protein
MNHISTLTVTQQYIHNQVRQVTKQHSEDILQIISAVMSAIDERFAENEAYILQVQKKVDQGKMMKDAQIE